jgi:hypothetical protein
MELQDQPVNGILTSFYLNGSSTPTDYWDPNLIFVNWNANDNLLIGFYPPFC